VLVETVFRRTGVRALSLLLSNVSKEFVVAKSVTVE
jgi:hypothetical protein